MRLAYAERFLRSYADAPSAIQKAFDRKAELLLRNLRHPSLQAKKYDVSRNLWQARVTLGWRLYFTVQNDTYYLVDMTPHPK
jgi:mRNA-degrading endonuclease RelE of RelBE toxin-antitoxin system